ncbi:MAG: hypothetical protein EOP49_01680 [Sphingobacteriales bacterium]|nr:MAG: hypothetical protein EOP49_01680 [Sphingobacteriales bacterium]
MSKLLNHFDKITALLMDCAIQTVKTGNGDNDNVSILHNNTRYIIACNFRLRAVNLIKIFNEILDIDGNAVFDEATANIITRSLLESYLVYFRLYNGCGDDLKLQELYFNLYDLSSVLQFIKYGKSIKGSKNSSFNEGNLRMQIKKLLNEINGNGKFRTLPTAVRDSITRISSGKQDYLSFINFSKLIRESPLPSEFISAYYSYASAFAHSEGFSSKFTQMIFESCERWTEMNGNLKLRMIYICLAVSSQFFLSFIQYDKTELEDEKEQEVWEIVSLSNYYLTALQHNK